MNCPTEETASELPAAFFEALTDQRTPTTALGSRRSIEPDRTLKVRHAEGAARAEGAFLGVGHGGGAHPLTLRCA